MPIKTRINQTKKEKPNSLVSKESSVAKISTISKQHKSALVNPLRKTLPQKNMMRRQKKATDYTKRKAQEQQALYNKLLNQEARDLDIAVKNILRYHKDNSV